MSALIELLARRLAQRSPAEIELSVREQAAIALILVPGADATAPELLLIQRAERSTDPWSGHMALPGGRRDSGDADLRATAVRETREETGVELGSARLVGRLDDLRPIRRSESPLAVRPFVYWAPRRPPLTLSDEVADALWVSLATLRASVTETEVRHRDLELRVPAYVIDGRVVWGMTQRVVAALLAFTEAVD